MSVAGLKTWWHHVSPKKEEAPVSTVPPSRNASSFGKNSPKPQGSGTKVSRNRGGPTKAMKALARPYFWVMEAFFILRIFLPALAIMLVALQAKPQAT